jgi:hypothetical protein
VGAERYVARCALCGTAYTVRAWYWLESLGIERFGEDRARSFDLRQCAVPGCSNAVARYSAIVAALGRSTASAANEVE